MHTSNRTLRCGTCGINYPYEGRFTSCQACGGPTSGFLGDVPHPDWEERVSAHKEHLRAGERSDPGDFPKVVAWRTTTLLGAGYDPISAEAIAGRTDVDLHQAVEMVKVGCEPELALEILL